MKPLICLAAAFLSGAAAQAPAPAKAPLQHAQPSGRWDIRFHFDRDREALAIQDIAAPGPGRVVAAGTWAREDEKPQGLVVLTRDGGKSWTEVKIKEPVRSLFFLNDSLGWAVTEGGIWRTEESGLSWKKVKSLKGVMRVWFLSPERGWAVGAPKLMMETNDGGRNWTDVAAVNEVKSNDDYTAFQWIQFVTPQRGTVNGVVIPPRPGSSRNMPVWADPEAAQQRRQWPNLAIGLDTVDGGKTWKADTAPVFGRPSRIRFSGAREGLALIQFDAGFEFPSEVYWVDPVNGKSERSFREKNRKVTDVGWLRDGHAALVSVEPPRVFTLPVPGRLHVLERRGAGAWTEMPVDWKAYAESAVMAGSEGRGWIGTDTGMVLEYVPNPAQ